VNSQQCELTGRSAWRPDTQSRRKAFNSSLTGTKKREALLERVALVVLSILGATGMLVGASYGAILLAPYLEDVSTNWVVTITLATFLIPMLLMYKRKRYGRRGAV
jgi:membrane-anchored glycerophosphoryl diester phosphodiesterase (GDPDase)